MLFRHRGRQYRRSPWPEASSNPGLTPLVVSRWSNTSESDGKSLSSSTFSDLDRPDLFAAFRCLQDTRAVQKGQPWRKRIPTGADSFGAFSCKPKAANDCGRNLAALDSYNDLVAWSIVPPERIKYHRRISLSRTPSPSGSSGIASTESLTFLKAKRVEVERVRNQRARALSSSAADLTRRPGLTQLENEHEQTLEDTMVNSRRSGFFHVINADDRTNIGVPGTWIIEDRTLSVQSSSTNDEETASVVKQRTCALAQLEGHEPKTRSGSPVPRYLQRYIARTTESGNGIGPSMPA